MCMHIYEQSKYICIYTYMYDSKDLPTCHMLGVAAFSWRCLARFSFSATQFSLAIYYYFEL